MLNKKLIILLFLLFFILVIPFIYNQYDLSNFIFINLKKYSKLIINFIDTYPLLSSLIYFVIVAISVVINLPGSSIKAILAGIFFGWYHGAILIILSITIGSFISIKFYGFFLKIMMQKNRLEKISKKINFDINNPSFTLLVFLRVATVIPLTIQNLIISSFRLNKATLLISTFIGISPILIIYTYIGHIFSKFLLHSVKSFNIWDLVNIKIIFSLVALIFFVMLLSIVSIKIKNLIIKQV